MKKMIIFLTLLSTITAFAGNDFYCKKSAAKYITYIASAPYIKSGVRVKSDDLILSSFKAIGDGIEAYELYTYKRVDSNEIYSLKLYVEEIGGVYPLEKFEVSFAE
jgi:hypothetical protein